MLESLMEFNMAATLAVACAIRFSETARSRPRHREARRGSGDDRAPAVRRRRLAHDRAEGPAERPEAREADLEADVAHRPVGLAEQEHGALDAAALEVAVRRLAERRAERADEVRLGHVREPRERRDVERPRVGAVHRVARAEHAAVSLLDGAAHTGIEPRTAPVSAAVPLVRNDRGPGDPGPPRVELAGLEPATSCMPCRRSPS